MTPKTSGPDQLFLKAEDLASDFSLFPEAGGLSGHQYLKGLLSERQIKTALKKLRKMKVDKYIAATVLPSEDQSRIGSKAVLSKIEGKVLRKIENGPLYALEMYLDFGKSQRRVGFLAQNRAANNGVWMPEHHLQAVDIIREFADYSIPIVTIIDTPGADAGEIANQNNQAHAISRLITEMSLVDLPTIAIVLGNGYSGGAIPLATTNMLLSVRDGVFNTIQPRGLASIARKYNLSWQECAKYVGVSPFELCQQGYIDGIIDFVPGESGEKLQNLTNAITSGIISIENGVLDFIKQNPYVFDHYRRSISRYIEPSESLESFQQQSLLALPKNPTGQLNIFGATYRYMRYLSLRNRLRSMTLERYGRLSEQEIPTGDLSARIEKEHRDAFNQWLESPLEVRYDNALSKSWKNYQYFKNRLHKQRGKIKKFILGDPKQNFEKSIEELNLSFAFHLYNLWKAGAQYNFISLTGHLSKKGQKSSRSKGKLTVLDIIGNDDIKNSMVEECRNFIIFDLVYNNIISNLISIAKEAHEFNVISKNKVKSLLDESIAKSVAEVIKNSPSKSLPKENTAETITAEFSEWLNAFIVNPRCGELLKSIEEWKKIAFPRISETLFAVITFYFEHLLPELFRSEQSPKQYEGHINPRNIGLKDFWNRLTIAYQDLLIQDLLTRYKRTKKANTKAIIDRFFTDFQELHSNFMTSDPVNFPGFRISIEQALSKGVVPCGIITGTGVLKIKGTRRKVGVMVSNLDFQAGAFDMASAEKFCKLMVKCAAKGFPIICFVSSGGMQTKEGAGALFSMAIVNDRISRFVRDNDLPVVCFGFGDCTGGAQASFVTHPLVQTYYFSGTNMPFAGQIVVPAYLPATATLSNYLSTEEGAMQGLVKHPFFEDLDDELKEFDPNIPVATETVEDVIARVLQGELTTEDEDAIEQTKTVSHLSLMKAVNRVLLHARGCTAVKLIRGAQSKGIEIVLVQSDADMDSVAADMLGENDRLVCLGGNTSDESYLNAKSVVRIAEREKVDSLHPGIGFLSENPQFADLCGRHRLNFIGPPVHSMERMGNKSNAINTALSIDVPVVPGSHGIITSSDAARSLSEEIGYPIVIKAVHGGGGKGIKMVDSSDNFHEIFTQMMAEAKSAFGNSDLYIEKCVTSLRHIEVQILRDRLGNTKVLGLRDCSVQRNNQKIIEESGSTMLTAKLQKAAFDYSGSIADKIGYIGAGTVEFIYNLDEKSVYFMEMNTRLQVEHPVTETVTGIDIVGAQFDVAAGKSIEDMVVKAKGYAIEVRITAERTAADESGEIIFLPDPGEVTEYDFPEDKNIQIISCIGKGKVVPSYYDSMIIQLICKGKDRDATIDYLGKYLNRVSIKGICTNIPLLKQILKDKIFRAGDYDTTYLPKFLARVDKKKLIKETEEAAGDVKKAFGLDALRIEDSDEIRVLAPSSGIFYIAPSPTDPPFVNVGDSVSNEQTLCLIEAMKVFRAISLQIYNSDGAIVYPPDTNYEVVRVNTTSGQAVNTGDLLFVVKPAKG